jgi:hypothetical protein
MFLDKFVVEDISNVCMSSPIFKISESRVDHTVIWTYNAI